MAQNKEHRHIEERPKKKMRCGCGGHSFNIPDKKDKSMKKFLKTGEIEEDEKAVKRKKNIEKNIKKRKSMKLNKIEEQKSK